MTEEASKSGSDSEIKNKIEQKMSDSQRRGRSSVPAVPAPALYPLKRTREEVRRLRIQAEALAFEAGVLLDRIGVEEGWRCLDLGCGAGGITDLLSDRVGRRGQVVGLDLDPVSLAAAQAWAAEQGLHHVAFVQGDAFAPPVRDEAFDLVHGRYVMTTIGRHREVVEAALRLVRPGGWLAVQEADATGLTCYPAHPAWYRLQGGPAHRVRAGGRRLLRRAPGLSAARRGGAGGGGVPPLSGWRPQRRPACRLPASHRSLHQARHPAPRPSLGS